MNAEPDATSGFCAGYELGRYELLCPIAQGGMAVVWLARLRGTRGFEKTVAVKLIRPQFGDDERFEQMFLDEATLASKIHHPNVVQIQELGEQDGTLFLVMEWIDGESLSRWRRLLRKAGHAFPLPIALRIIADACAGLHAAHELCGEDGKLLGVVHRDVSPQNILLSASGAVKVIDFGIAKAKSRAVAETRDGMLKGKVPYMAPEQVRGKDLGRGVDIWAAGVCLYELLTDELPFDGESFSEILEQIGASVRPPALPTELPPAVRDILERALHPDLQRRFPTASAMQRAIEMTIAQLGTITTSEDVGQLLHQKLGDHLQTRQRSLSSALRSASARIRADQGLPEDDRETLADAPIVTLAASELQTLTSSALSAPVAEARTVPMGPRTAGRRRSLAWLLAVSIVVVLAGVALTVRMLAEPKNEAPRYPASKEPAIASTAPPSTPVMPAMPVTASASIVASASASTSSAAGKKPSVAAPAKTLSPAGRDYGF